MNDFNTLYWAAKELVEALDNAFISSWQSTAEWAKQLDALREIVKIHE